MMKKVSLVAAGVAAAVCSMSASALSYNGYFRSGTGWSDGGTDQVCFKAHGQEGAKSKYRLGNECETYVEMDFGQELFTADDGSVFKAHIRLGYESNQDRDFENTKGDTLDVALRETWVEGSGFLGQGINVWAGKRFYRRHDVHLNDEFYIANTGPGAGVEGIDLGLGKLAVAWVRNNPNDNGPAQNNLDTQLTDIAVPMGALSVIFNYGFTSEQGKNSAYDAEDYEAMDGFKFEFIYDMNDFLGGSNQVVFQYGTGVYGAKAAWGSSLLSQYGAWGSSSFAAGDDVAEDVQDSSSWRLYDQAYIQPMEDLSVGLFAMYQMNDYADQTYNWGQGDVEADEKTIISFGVRPIYHFSDYLALQAELGFDMIENANTWWQNSQEDSELMKFTVAPTLRAGKGFWNRPELRVFYTYASWNDEVEGAVGGPAYSAETSGSSYGFQAEAWW